MNEKESIARFKKLVSAAATLSCAGLARDPECASIEMREEQSSLQFAVPFKPERVTVVLGGYWGSALESILEIICTRSGVVATRPKSNKFGSWLAVEVKAPQAVSAHEILEASALLRAAFTEWSVDPAETDRLLELR